MRCWRSWSNKPPRHAHDRARAQPHQRVTPVTPSRRLIAVLLAWAALGFVAGSWPPLVPVWWAVGAALWVVCALDARRVWPVPALRVQRQAAGVWPVDVWNAVTVSLHNEGKQVLNAELFDAYPTAWSLEGLPHRSRIEPGQVNRVTYRLMPNARGDAQFGQAQLRVTSPWGLWLRLHRLGDTSEVKVFPDFSKLIGHTLSATDRRVRSSGVVRKRQRGEGTDFRQLRDYREGDSLRAIDWKATSRQRKPIVREYQEERDQQVVFLLDTGRRMLARDAQGAHFDHALNAVLTLAFLAQKQGDSVGLLGFGSQTTWVPPHKGRVGLDRLLAGIYHLQPDQAAPDYLAAASALMQRLGKRAFVVLITNVRDEDDQALQTACHLLSSRHLVLCASLRELALDAAQGQPIDGLSDALRSSATALYAQQRQEAIKRLGLRAQDLIDVLPAQLSMALVNRYNDVKESGRL